MNRTKRRLEFLLLRLIQLSIFLKYLWLLLAIPLVAQTYTVDANLDNSTNNLSTCVLPSCDPGGSGPPTAVWNKIVSTTPCGNPSDSKAMEFYVAGNPYVNALWVYKTGPIPLATHFQMSWRVCFDQNISTAQAFEADIANFVSGNPGVNYMFGGQCELIKHIYQVWDQLNPRWIDTGIPCSLTGNKWHTFTRQVHTDANKALWFDSLTIDGKTYPETAMGKYSAGPLPGGWNSTRIWQVQLDIGPSGTPLTMWVDKLTGIAWQ